MRELKIVEAENGYILSFDVLMDEDGHVELCQSVIEENGDTNDLFRRLLETVAEHFGMEYNKWKSDNLNITFDKKGHECE